MIRDWNIARYFSVLIWKLHHNTIAKTSQKIKVKIYSLTTKGFAGGVYSYAFNNNLSTSRALQEGIKKFDKSNIGITGGLGIDYKNLTVDLRYENNLFLS